MCTTPPRKFAAPIPGGLVLCRTSDGAVMTTLFLGWDRSDPDLRDDVSDKPAYGTYHELAGTYAAGLGGLLSTARNPVRHVLGWVPDAWCIVRPLKSLKSLKRIKELN